MITTLSHCVSSRETSISRGEGAVSRKLVPSEGGQGKGPLAGASQEETMH